MATYKLTGQVKNKKTGRGFQGLFVEAWDKDVKDNDLLGTATTDAEGHFDIAFDDAAFSDKGKDLQPDVFVKIFSGKILLHSTETKPIENWTPKHPPLVVEVNPAVPPEDDKLLGVEGEVVTPDGTPLQNYLVRAFDRALCGWRSMGEARTNDDGRYRISFDPAQLEQWDKKQADLKVEVYDASPTGGALLATSPIILQALPKEEIDFSIGEENYRGPDEFSRVDRALQPLLESRDDLSCIGVADVLLLARASGHNPSNVAYYVKAHILSIGLDLPPAVFYGLFRQIGNAQMSTVFVRPLSILWQDLESAKALNLFNVELVGALKTQLSEVQQQYLNDPEQSYTKLLQTTALSTGERDVFTRLLASGTQTRETFWKTLEAEAQFTSAQIEDLQQAFKLQSLTGNTSLTIHLRSALDVHRPQDITVFSLEQWEDIVSTQGVEIPDDFLPGEDDPVRRKRYAQAIYHAAETGFPTPSLAEQMRRSTSWQKPDVLQFIDDHRDFEFENQRILFLLGEDSEIPEALAKDLLHLEQMFHLTEHRDKLSTIEALWDTGLQSAPKIAAAGRRHLFRQVPTLEKPVVNRIYRKALHMTSRALHLYISNHPNINRLTTNALRSRQLTQGTITLPEWEELFGSADTCECTHCQSALSPSAYLVNILDYLQRATDDDGNNALDYFLERRPDLGKLQLTCDNTDTELPKIDLLIEMMEEIVAYSNDGTTIPNTYAGQTTWDNALLEAQPEHMAAEAYSKLRNAVYPFKRVPFDLWLEESRRYLLQMGVTREQLMQVIPPHPDAGDLEIATETLGMTSREWEIIQTPNIRPDDLADYWGIDLDRGSLPAQLGKVEKLLRQADMDYHSLLQLLNTRYVNPNRQITISLDDNSCSLDDARIADVDDNPLDPEDFRPFVDRLHRFLRLQRHVGCSEYELDGLLACLGYEDFNEPRFLFMLAQVQTLHKTLGLSITELCSWWTTLSTYAYEEGLPSPYESIFLNPAVFPDTASSTETDLRNDVFALTVDRSDLVITQSTTLNPWLAQWNASTETYELDSGYAGYIQSATRLTSVDIALLAAEVLPKSGDGHVALNLANVSLLYRVGSFTRVHKISIAAYLQLTRLTGKTALTTFAHTVTPLETVNVRDSLLEIDADKWSIDELAYLLLHDSEAAGRFAPTVADMDLLRDELNVAVAGLVIPEGEDPLATVKKDIAFRATLTQSLGTSLGLEAELVDELVFSYRSGLGNDLLINLLLWLEPERTDLPTAGMDFYQLYETLHKFSLAWLPMGLDQVHLAFVAIRGPVIGWTDITGLPLDETTDADLEAWHRLTSAATLQNDVFTTEHSLFDLINAIHEEGLRGDELLARTSEWTGWGFANLSYLAGPDGFAWELNDFVDERWLLMVQKVLDLVKPLGVTAAQAHTWTRPKLTSVESESIKQALTLAYDPDRWLEVMADIQDDLRNLKRNALLGYQMDHLDFKDSNDFYNHFWLDPEVDPCANTSRIVEAHAAVQLFTQRILLNLEGSFSFAPEDAEGWQWRKNYRVWEAAGKIFLFPENWMDPEWRDNKSGFFKELEDGLLQDDVTRESVERIYREYLYKLDQVSRLEIMGMYEDVDAARETNTLHVFGRTKDVPHLYYYRRWENQSRWTAWEKVDLDINSDHLIPIVYNGRLYLFWPDLTVTQLEPPIAELEKELEDLNEQIALLYTSINNINAQIDDLEDEDQVTQDLIMPILTAQLKITDIQKSSKEEEIVAKQARIDEILEHHINFHMELKMAWSQYDGNRWSAKSLTKQTQTHIYETNASVALHHFTGWVSGDNQLFVDIYTLDSDGYAGISVKEPLGYFSFDKCGAELVFSNLPHITPDGDVWVSGSHHRFNYWDINVRSLSLHFNDETSQRILLLRDDNYDEYKRVYYAHQYGQGGSTTSPYFFADAKRTYFVQPLPESIIIDVRPKLDRAEDTGKKLSTRPNDTLSKNRLSAASLHYQDINTDQIIDRALEGRSLSTIAGLNNTVTDILVKSETVAWQSSEVVMPTEFLYRFDRFYHPYTCLFLKQLSRYGIEGLLNPDPVWDDDSKDLYRQLTPLEEFSFKATYDPKSWVHSSYPNQEVDFDHDSPYGGYNWELFFHIPLLIATRLMQNQKFDEALRWFHYIFNPTCTDGEGPERFWKIKPFYEEQSNGPIATLSELIDLLEKHGNQMEQQVEAWELDPFNPFVIGRLRTVAFMKTTVMKYLDCLIAKADMLFTLGTREFVNEATQYYLLAVEILGDQPTLLPEQEPVTYTPNVLLRRIDIDLPDISVPSNPLDLLTSLFPTTRAGRPSHRTSAPVIVGNTSPSRATGTYNTLWLFCLPHNEMLYGYWDTVADRLFKIRHCMNIEGQVRHLPLFAPAIDPALLVRAGVTGLDIASIISGLYAPLPNYRFSFMLQKALEICGEVRNLGGALLAALEKKDGEDLSLLRSANEISLLEAIRTLKKKSVEEAESSLASLMKSKESAEFRRDYYSSLERVNRGEQTSLDSLDESRFFQKKAESQESLASGLSLLPNISSGAPPSISFGGSNLGAAAQSIAGGLRANANAQSYESGRSATIAGYDRRQQDWDFQADLANKEIDQLEKQILAAEIRQQIAENDLANHEKQMAQAEEVEEFLKLKFTNQQLYNWMISKVSALYFQAYQMAMQIARQAEKTFQHELGPEERNASFIQASYWDSLKKGLTAGDQLNLDLRRMEEAHLAANKRELEITKHVSLFQLNPEALLNLRETGSCDFHIPELLFAMDFAGHYFRRIKAVRITIPCVTGPYTNVSTTLSLTDSWTRNNTDSEDVEQPVQDVTVLPQTAIATSSANQDGGIFELNFNDPRYLPFEGAGAISSWRLELPSVIRQFDYDTITDVVVHLSYTARDAGEGPFKTAVNAQLADSSATLETSDVTLSRLFSLRQEFSGEWHRLLHPVEGENQKATLTLTKNHFPRYLDYFWVKDTETEDVDVRSISLSFNSVDLYLNPKGAMPSDIDSTLINGITPAVLPDLPELRVVSLSTISDITNETASELEVKVTSGELRPEDWKDAYILLRYTIST